MKIDDVDMARESMSRIYDMASRSIEARSRANKVSRIQDMVMVHIALSPGISQVELAGAMSTTKQYISRVVKWLEELGVVETRTSISDQRKQALYLTGQGERQEKEWREISDRRVRERVKALSKEEAVRFYTAFRDLNELLPKLVGDDGTLF